MSRKDPEEMHSRNEKKNIWIYLIFLIALSLMLITVVIIQPIEIELQGKVSGGFKGLIELVQKDWLRRESPFENFKITDSNGNIEGSVKIKVPMVLLFVLQSWNR